MNPIKSSLMAVIFMSNAFSSLQAASEFNSNHTPEFPSYFNTGAQKSTPTEKDKKAEPVKTVDSKITVKIITIAKNEQTAIKKAYKNYNVVAARKALTRKAPKSDVYKVANHYGASVVFFRPYVKNDTNYYDYFFLRRK